MMTKRSAEQTSYDCLAGGGEMGRLMRTHDWSSTPFGPVENWPQSLRTAISLMLESRFAMVIAWGPDFRFFYNDRYRPVLGASKHPFALGTPAREIFPEAWPQIGPLFESTRNGESFGMDDFLVPLDRYGYLENCYFTLSYSPIRDESGGVGGMLAVVAETTERVQGERRLKTLRDLSRRASDAKTAKEACIDAAQTLGENPIDVPFALLYLVEQGGTIARLESASGLAPGTAASPERVELSQREPQGWPLSAVVEDASVQILDDLPRRFGDLPAGPYPEPTHCALLVPLVRSGQRQPDGILIFGVSPRRALDDQYRAFFELAADHIQTAIRNALAYQEERERAERLAELDRAKTIFFSNVSHEFRTPLTLMLGPLEDTLADHNRRLLPEDREQLSVVHRNSLRLLKLVNTLLDFSRIESGRIEAVYEPLDLASYTAELASVFRSTVERAGLTLIVDCRPLPEPTYADKEMWEKIVLNLISNAFKFTFEGEIVVRLNWAEGRIELEVRDTGTGIPEAELPNLFKRFHRVRGARARTYEGSGIGLALVQELVRLHGGTIDVASTVEVGTTFIVSIPAGHHHLTTQSIKPERTGASTATLTRPFVEEALRWLPEAVDEDHGVDSNGGLFADINRHLESEVRPQYIQDSNKPNILLADDNADMRDYVKRLLAPKYNVEVVADGAMALEAARQKPPDLILSDVMMPRMDGFELLQLLRGDPATQNIPVIMLSARAGEESRVEGLQAGADDYLVKPFSARELLARVKARIDLNQMREEARRQVSTILESITDGFIALDKEWRFTYINRKAEEILHKLHRISSDLMGKSFWKEFPDLVDTVVYDECHRAVGEQAAVGFELYYPSLDSWLGFHAYPSADGLSVYFQEITERKKALEETKKERSHARFLAEASETLAESLDYEATLKNLARIAVSYMADWCAVDAIDDTGRLRRVAGARKDPDREKLLIDLQEKFSQDWDSQEPSARVLRTGKSELLREVTDDPMSQPPGDAPHLKLVGEIGLKSHMTVVLSARGNKMGAISFGLFEGDARYGPEDLSLAEELARRAAFALDNARLYRVAQDANKMKDEFLATVSHELRTPLNAVLGWARILRTARLDPEASNRALETIERNARSQAQLIDDLLDVSRIISGKLRLDVRPVEIVSVIEAAIDTVRHAAEAKQIRLQPILDRFGEIVLGDATRLQQVVWNLLSNAIKFTAKGGRVQISVSRVNSHVEIVVSDSGQGISREFLPYVFDRFRQADASNSRPHGGLGLGLAIVKHLVEMHGGGVRADSPGEGKGATFTVNLPVSITRDLKMGTKGDASQSVQLVGADMILDEAALDGLHILIVDDEADARDFLHTMLGHCGAKITSVGSAAEALEVLATAPPGERPDVLVSDIGLPNEDGYSLIRKVRMLPPEQGGQIKAIALTAYARFEDRMRALTAGFQMHVAKPVEPAELTMVLISLMGRPIKPR